MSVAAVVTSPIVPSVDGILEIITGYAAVTVHTVDHNRPTGCMRIEPIDMLRSSVILSPSLLDVITAHRTRLDVVVMHLFMGPLEHH